MIADASPPTGRRPRAGPAAKSEREQIRRILLQRPDRAARGLLGMHLVGENGHGTFTARIVETEAYLGQDDPAAHAFRGRTVRTEPLWGPPGTWYVYLIYGVHHCLNVAVEPEGRPGCVLIRGVEIAGQPAAAGRGPGKLTRELGIDCSRSGASAFGDDARLWLRYGPPPRRIDVSTRIGIRHAADRPLRYFDAESSAVSRRPRDPTDER
jgi:DNA-3-methyladenine glycosylase